MASAERALRSGVECGEVALALAGPGAATAAAAVCGAAALYGYSPERIARELARRVGL